jgi:allantoinase
MVALASSPTTLLFHAEMIPPISDSVGDDVQTSLPPLQPTGPLNAYATFLSSRPPAFETYAIEEVLSLAHLAPNLPLHIVHLSAVECIPILRAARASGIKITAETCFHYLALCAEDVSKGDTRHKCCPPIRGSTNREGLWTELSNIDQDSVIQTVVSDHSPCTPELKLLPDHLNVTNGHSKGRSNEEEKGDFFSAWGGISSVGLGLPILWTSTHANTHVAPLDILDVVKLCCVNTAKQVGLSHRKGAIAPGMDADICVFDPEGTFVVERAEMLFRNKVSPYQGKKMYGCVRETYLRGTSVFKRDAEAAGFGAEKRPRGVLLLEKRKA